MTTERNAAIIERWQKEPYPTGQTLASQFGITRERVRQIINQAIAGGTCISLTEHWKRWRVYRTKQVRPPRNRCTVCEVPLRIDARPYRDGNYYCSHCRTPIQNYGNNVCAVCGAKVTLQARMRKDGSYRCGRHKHMWKLPG